MIDDGMRRRRVATAALIVFAMAAGVALMTGTSAAQTTCPPASGGESCPAPGASSPDPTPLVGATPPALSGKNLTGRGILDLASLAGKPTAVVFWLNTCPHCRKVMPQINRLGRRVGPAKQVVAAVIDAGLKGPDGFKTPAAATRKLRLTIPTILASKPQADAWRVPVTPTTYIIDSAGVITNVIQPGGSANIARQIEQALAQTP